MSLINLWCSVRKTLSTFPVTIGTNKNIFDLKVDVAIIDNNISIDDFLNDNLVKTGDTVEVTFPYIERCNVRVIVDGDSMEPTGLVHIFIDNYNVAIEGKKMVNEIKDVFEDQLYIDYGRYPRTVLKKRKIGRGSSYQLEKLGFRVSVYDQNFLDKEKDELVASIGDAIQEHKRPGIIVLFVGECDYGP
ncbi:7266_t:CDS:2 [Funneliformis caledonium]|uniref:7266_t:CDS:1 n=1 Tax=Funneliformis caledonium TaxID=1117310 RepID=A0A9N9GYZ7_9GLOM|nr:7266_t:CDS:2 [Funneliformis caledonium]